MSAPRIWSRDDIREAAICADLAKGTRDYAIEPILRVLEFAEKHQQPRDERGRFAPKLREVA